MQWGVTGFGVIARTRFVPGLQRVPGARLAAVQNRSAQKASTYAAQLGCKGYGTVQELLANPEVEAVQSASQGWALSQPKGGDTEDTAAMTLMLTGGILASVLVSFATPGMENRLEVYGTEGVLWTDGSIGQESAGRLFLRRGDGEVQNLTPRAIPEIYAAEIDHLEQCARTGRRPLSDAVDGARDLAAVLAAAQSAAKGRAVRPQPVER